LCLPNKLDPGLRRDDSIFKLPIKTQRKRALSHPHNL
jgi:hypothetical protein